MYALTSVIVFWIVLIGLLTFQVTAAHQSGFVGSPKTVDPNPRNPYHLLNGWLESGNKDSIGCLTAGCCHETDFEQRTNKVGNYLQRTNNYKRGDPENCSAPFQELTLSFYKPTPL
jgi:hypothetical protein